MGAKLDFYKTTLRNRARKGFLGHPVATVAFYGPDDRRATKVAVAVIHNEDDDAKEITKWQIDKGDIRREKTMAGLAHHHNSPSSDIETAQDLMSDAWDTSDRKKRVAMARRALEISPDCADAYVMLAEETSRDLADALDLYQKGVAAGERALGPKAFEESAGHFWGILETRPYMRARNGLAECLREMGRPAEAIDHFQELLRLNPNDNQGNRSLLAACYLEAGRDSEAWDLLNRYPEGITASWAYTAALVQFRLNGASMEAGKALKHAIDQNPHVREYLCGRKRMPRETPHHYRIGSTDEAVIYVHLNGAHWKKIPGAIAWLDSKDR